MRELVCGKCVRALNIIPRQKVKEALKQPVPLVEGATHERVCLCVLSVCVVCLCECVCCLCVLSVSVPLVEGATHERVCLCVSCVSVCLCVCV